MNTLSPFCRLANERLVRAFLLENLSHTFSHFSFGIFVSYFQVYVNARECANWLAILPFHSQSN